MLRKEDHARIYWDEKNKTKQKFENTTGRNKQKILTKEGWLKKYRDKGKQYKQNR